MINELKSLIIKPSLHHHEYSHHNCEETVPDEFGVLCWNVHKNNDNFNFRHYMEDFDSRHPIDFYMLQEADFKHEREFNIQDTSFKAAANLEKGNAFYGVLTASKCRTKHSLPLISKGKELILGPKKSLLLTKHEFSDGEELWLLNLHAINFRENRHYYREIEHIAEAVEAYKGALIVAGDFNTWNKKRTKYLFEKMESMGMSRVGFSKKDKVKSFMRNHLDFIFYRGVNLEEKQIERTHNISDHHPLYARFSREKNRGI